jgi:hypothetical protein
MRLFLREGLTFRIFLVFIFCGVENPEMTPEEASRARLSTAEVQGSSDLLFEKVVFFFITGLIHHDSSAFVDGERRSSDGRERS